MLAAALAAIVAVALIAWAVTSTGGNTTTAPPAPAPAPASVLPKIGPIGLSAAGLKAFAKNTLKHPVYWAGAAKGDVYELTRTSNGNAYVRYLPPGVKVGDPRHDWLIVVTYPFPSALPRLTAVANGRGVHLPGGAFALPDAGYPKSVHMAFPGVNYEIEVYNPSPKVALSVATSGHIRPVG